MVFVTGGTGLLGTHVLIELLVRGEKIRALRRSVARSEKVRKIFSHYFGEGADVEFDKIEWVDGNVLDLLSIREGMKDCQVVYHCAAMVSFVAGDFQQLIKINKEGTANVVNTALDAGIDHLCYISSTAAIGKPPGKEMLDESDRWLRAKEHSNYSVSKHLAEMEVFRGIEEGLNAVIVNPGVIFGPGDWNESSLTIFKAGKKGMRLYSTGGNAFVDARDVAKVTAELSAKRIFNDRFLVISENVSFRTVFTMISEKFGTAPPTIRARKWMTDIAWRIEAFLRFFIGKTPRLTRETARGAMRTTRYSNQKIRERINYTFITVEQSISDTVKFFQRD